MPLNIGTGIGTSIRELVETINEVTGFEGKIVWNTDKPDGAMKKVLDVTRMKQELDGWAPPTSLRDGPGQDDRLVPGQQGPGGREMVNRRFWFRGGPSPARPMFAQIDLSDGGGDAAWARRGRRALGHLHERRRRPDDDPQPGRRLLFINQYYWPDHASTAQHLTDLAESLAARGYECHVLCAQGRYAARRAGPPAFEVHEGVHIHRVPATSLGRRSTLTPDGRLPQLLRPGASSRRCGCRGSTPSSR